MGKIPSQCFFEPIFEKKSLQHFVFFSENTCFYKRITKSCLSVPREKKSPLFRQYQFYSNKKDTSIESFIQVLQHESKKKKT